MSDHRPGSTEWWVETALITMGGVAIALWLWPTPAPPDHPVPASALPQASQPPETLADLLAAGCLTVGDLQAMREGHQIRPTCPPQVAR